MSEKLSTPSPEKQQSPERQSSQEKKLLEELQKKAERADNKPKDSIESIKKSIESSAVSGKEYSIGEKQPKPSSQTYGASRQLKDQAFTRTLKKAQRQLSAPERTFSKIIHTPLIEKTSDVAAKTIARPSGILLGSICAFIATTMVLVISKRSGFTYNYLLFFLVFVAGHIAGTAIELVIRSIKKSSD